MQGRGLGIQYVVLMLSVLVSCSVFSHEHMPGVFGTPIPRSYFGLHISQEDEMWPRDMQFGGWRLIDNSVLWRDLEPQQNKWIWYHLDHLVDVAEAHQVSPVYTLGFTPAWAWGAPDPSLPYSSFNAAPQDIGSWREYVQTMATRYQGRIHEWELWNEANDHAFYSGSVEEMVNLAQAAYEVLKRVDPTNTVISPSVTYGMQGTLWLDNYLRAGGGKYADVIGYHLYVTSPEKEVPLIHKIRSVMAANGVGNKPLWNTETGWAIENNNGEDMERAKALGLAPISSSQAGAYAIRSLVLAWDAGVSRYYWYTWDAQPESMLEPDGTPKGAAVALAQGIKWLTGATMESCDWDESDTWICHITRDEGYNGYIVWNSKGLKEFSIPAAWHVSNERDMFANSVPMQSLHVRISTEPVLLENQDP